MTLEGFWQYAEFWLRMQLAYDLAQVSAKADQIHVQRYQPAA